MSVSKFLKKVRSNPKMQGHICISNNELFDISLKLGVYGFPSRKLQSADKLHNSAWRAISSLYNIGVNDLIFFYRTKAKKPKPGSQEIHGIFQVKEQEGEPILFLHWNDNKFLPSLPKKKKDEEERLIPFRFFFDSEFAYPISIPNDYENDLEIIKALSEIDSTKPRLWGFRHPAVMNIGAARKKSIVAISNKQLEFLLQLLEKECARSISADTSHLSPYTPSQLPTDCVKFNGKFMIEHFARYPSKKRKFPEFEAELYAYLLCGLRNPNCDFHRALIRDLKAINSDSSIEFSKISSNAILETVVTPHIQEEIDILLCDQEENNFLILELKNKPISSEDVEQTKKYIQLMKHRFPKSNSVRANIIGPKTQARPSPQSGITFGYYERESQSDGTYFLRFKAN